MQPPLIIGGGPAGAAAAAVIAGAGREIRLIERSSGPTDKVCGDFLSIGALTLLEALEIDPLALGGASISTLRLVYRRLVAETRLPFRAVGLTRRALDEALLQTAAARGAELLRGKAVQRLEPTAGGFTAQTTTLGPLPSASVFLATGKHDLRGLPRPHDADEPVGLKMYYELMPDQRAELEECIELVLFPGGYAGLQLVEHGRAVLCLMLSARRFRSAGASWDSLLVSFAGCAPHLVARLRGATPALDRPLAIAAIPYGYRHRTPPAAPPNLFRLGDQACVIPSLAGDGVAIALASGTLAARTWLRREGAPVYDRLLQHCINRQLRLASLVHRGCTAPPLQPLVAALARARPGIMRLVAGATRIATA
jgi:flavin-dependent dehydrogenase